MKQLKIAVCDDAVQDVQVLGQLLKELMPEAEIRTYTSGDSLLKILETKGNPFCVIFLDIHMPGNSGIATAEEIRKWDRAVPIIFVSRSDGYYREAFDVFAFQYLLKPVEKEKLSKVLKPLMEFWSEEKEPMLHFRYRSQMYTLRHSQICYISSSLHTVNFHLTDGRCIQCRGKLNDFSEQLEGSALVRCHQSFFVNMSAVTGMKTDSFILRDTMIPISRSFAKTVQEIYEKYLKEK